ncbi:hypothetical protein [uncultured Xylophilus sp.]|uniref:hypothetical protein n=1 Tax=uncultured Xylophilus sp. TaxID=296832 RepID=UPI0025FB0F62|nr:hypothetical protein [uncultured Xylophilus sp.]
MAENENIDSTPRPALQGAVHGKPDDAVPDAIGPSDDAQQPGGQVDGGSAGDRMQIDFDDDEIYSGRGKNVRMGGTQQAEGGDSGELGTPAEQLSDRIGPSDKGD